MTCSAAQRSNLGAQRSAASIFCICVGQTTAFVVVRLKVDAKVVTLNFGRFRGKK